MRYYGMTIYTNADKIKEQAKINLREYDYLNPITAVNNYIHANIKNNLYFFAYREEEDLTLAAFAYDEKKEVFRNAYDDVSTMLNEVFGINRIKADPHEVTMHEFYEYLLEGKRRTYVPAFYKYAEETNLLIFESDKNGSCPPYYRLDEKIISENDEKEKIMYSEDFLKELTNIETHKNLSEYQGNMVHYIISGRSMEAACDMTEALVQSLAKANRIIGRRIEIISEIEPDLYIKNTYLEEIIENNYGGVIIFDLSEKFGSDPIDYQMTCKYLERLVKEYRNDCLFIFTYNMEKPGFSYYLLPEIKKYVMPIMLREGTGDRRAAVNYMKGLIKTSKYSGYAEQADEFMKLCPGDQFSQTDVLKAYEQFEAWCLNKNILKAYDYDFSEDFCLDRDENTASSYEKLNQMIGLETVKKEIKNIISADIVEKERKKRLGNSYHPGTMHMIFGGNPGSAKTTVAKLFAGITKEKGILKSGAFVERGGMDLDGMGCISQIRESFTAAKGGVLFIDEAYSLQSDTAVTVLIQEMENHREDVIVILAGYNERMRSFMEINEGLKSRIPYWIDFPDYDADELTDIFKLMSRDRAFTLTEDAIKEARYLFEKARFKENFGNGRYVRNLLERAIQKQSVRLLSARENAFNIQKRELFLITKCDLEMPEEGHGGKKTSVTAREKLESMIGLSRAKEVIKKAIAGFKIKKICLDKGLRKDNFSLHMVFTGNPGTAKTTVARLFAEILKDEKVLPTGAFVEVGRAELVGNHVGATAPLVKKRFKEARGGVLFIDEAYSLCDSCENSFGDEAINTIVQEMENHRDNVIVIFAGYPDRMKHFLDRNPGLLSRIAFHVEFDDYSTDELCEITRLMLSNKQMSITKAGMEKLRKIYEDVRKRSDFGNGRFVRKVLEETEMNLAERLLEIDESKLTDQLITTIEECDISEPDLFKETEKMRIGFCA